MKICMLLFHDFTTPRIDPRVYKEAKSLIDNGIDVTVVCWAVDFGGSGKNIENLKEHDTFEGIAIKRIFQKISPKKRTIFFRAIQQFSSMFKLAFVTKAEKPDMIHANDLNTLLSGVIAKKILRKPLIYDSHEYWVGVISERNGRFLGKMCEIYEKILLTQVDHTITVSEEISKKLNVNDHQVSIIYNSRKLDESENIPRTKIDELKNSLNISENDFIVGYIGNITHIRGIDKLIEAFEYIGHENVKLLVVGSGNEKYMDDLVNKVKPELLDRVIFTGHIPYHEVMLYFSLLDVGCVLFQPHPNHFVAAPNKLFEYMSMKIPLLVSDFPEMCRIITNSKCGICVDPTDPKKIANSIVRMYENSNNFDDFGANGYRAFIEKFSWDRMEEELLNIYLEQKT